MRTKQSLSASFSVRTVVVSAALVQLLLVYAPSALAVPSYSRRYEVECSTCHTMWGALNGKGVTFRLSGYRAINGKDIKPVAEDIELGKDAAMPKTLPLSFITGVGIDSRTEKRDASNGTSSTSKGSTIALEDASIFLTSPLGPHLSAFVEFPMFETRAWEFTPTGKFEANNTGIGRDIQFGTESPAFEVAKFFWNNPFGDSLPRDSLNFLAGITHPPLAYAPGKVRLSVNQYLIYERTALELISPNKVSGVLGGEINDTIFRLSEPQTLVEVMGMTTFGAPVADVGQKETLWGEYHLGITNGSNAKADNNTKKDLYGRGVLRWYNQSLGLFVYRSGDSYGSDVRTNASIAANAEGIMSGAQTANQMRRFGPDMTLSLAPFGYPIWLENQLMWNRENNPTGFNKEFKWHGGFHQLNWQPSKNTIGYVRYDYVRGDAFNDTTSTVNGVTGITLAQPSEHDVVFGVQHLVSQTTKLVAEYRTHEFEDKSTATPSKLKDTGFTVRAMFGF
jgi:hypothetical protein